MPPEALPQMLANAGLGALRTVGVYAFTLAIVRLGSRRLLSKSTTFDYVVAIMLGSIMSGAMTGSSPIVPTAFTGGLLVCVHWVFAAIAFNTDWFGRFVKGGRIKLLENGELRKEGMARAKLTSRDLEQALREHDEPTDFLKIERAYLERSGEISIVPKSHEPRIVDIAVENGVQTVRIELRD